MLHHICVTYCHSDIHKDLAYRNSDIPFFFAFSKSLFNRPGAAKDFFLQIATQKPMLTISSALIYLIGILFSHIKFSVCTSYISGGYVLKYIIFLGNTTSRIKLEKI